MKLEEIWRQKSDQELEFAVMVISDYTEEAQEVIRVETQRRGLTEPPQLSPTKASIIQNDTHLLGNFLEEYSNGSFSGLIVAIIRVLILLIIGAFIITTSASFPFKLTTSAFFIGCALLTIYRVIQQRQQNILVYEQGIVYEQPNKRLSAQAIVCTL